MKRTFKVAPSYIRCSSANSYGDKIDSAVEYSRIFKYVDSTKTIEYSTDPDDSIVEIKLKDPYKCKYVARVGWFNDTVTVVPNRGWITSGSPDKYVVVPSTASLNGAVKILDKLSDTIELQTQKFLDAEELDKMKTQATLSRKAADAAEYPLSDIELSIIKEAFDYMLQRPSWRSILSYRDGNDRRSFISRVFHIADEKSKSMKLDGQLDARSRAWTKKPAVIRDKIDEYLTTSGF